MMRRSVNISQDVVDYMNTHPAFIAGKLGCIMDNEFYTRYMLNPIDKLKIPETRKYRNAIQLDDPFTMEDAEAFLKWMDPFWTDYKGLSQSEFFIEESVTLEDEEDFIV